MRALASHPCGPGLIPVSGIICGLSLLLVLVLVLRVFMQVLWFPPSTETNTSKFEFDQEFKGHRFVSHDCYVQPSLNKRNVKVLL